MSGYDENVYENACKIHGHSLTTTIKATIYDDTSKNFVNDLEVLCFRCGISLEEVRTLKIKKARTPRKKADEAPAQGAAA